VTFLLCGRARYNKLAYGWSHYISHVVFLGVVMGTFLFLSLVEFSFNHHVFGQIQSELGLGVGTGGKILPASHPLAQALGQFYARRTTGLLLPGASPRCCLQVPFAQQQV